MTQILLATDYSRKQSGRKVNYSCSGRKDTKKMKACGHESKMQYQAAAALTLNNHASLTVQ